MTISIIDVCHAAERMARSVVLTHLPEAAFPDLGEAEAKDDCIVQYTGLEQLGLAPLIIINETLFLQWAKDEARNGGCDFHRAAWDRGFDNIKLWGYPVRVVYCSRETPANFEIHITSRNGHFSFLGG